MTIGCIEDIKDVWQSVQSRNRPVLTESSFTVVVLELVLFMSGPLNSDACPCMSAASSVVSLARTTLEPLDEAAPKRQCSLDQSTKGLVTHRPGWWWTSCRTVIRLSIHMNELTSEFTATELSANKPTSPSSLEDDCLVGERLRSRCRSVDDEGCSREHAPILSNHPQVLVEEEDTEVGGAGEPLE